ncbi:MAG: hypothetical protein GY913_04690 [Proteobacteria bacterium]|nr:hypothetical protein [Pseudomonadota bacterium]MCP4916198.1 hypothetical protein [Pseudomonadota bacterium]
MIRSFLLTWAVAAVLVGATALLGIALAGPSISDGELAVMLLVPLHGGTWFGSTLVYAIRIRDLPAETARKAVAIALHLVGSTLFSAMGVIALLIVFNR